MSHVLGYLSDRHGVGGVEKTYDQLLSGVDGRELYEIDAQGQKLRLLGKREPVSGTDIQLTVDSRLNKVSLSAMGSGYGAVVVSNPISGEILALVSSPTFDPEKISGVLDDKSQPLFNRAITGTYPPGSTFKIVVATGGLEEKVIEPTTRIEDKGVLVIGEYRFPNWKWLKNGGVDGWLDLTGALQRSNDIFFYEVGGRLGVDGLTSWAGRFGLGKPLGIDLPQEASGVVPNALWRRDHNINWYLGDTYHLAIGQGDLLVTPLQVNSWTSVIANGGKLCLPHLSGQNKNCKDLGIKKENIELVKKGMVAACAPGGTAYPLFDLKMACKTGTAEFGDPNNRTHAWLTGFYPIESPKIAITVLVEAAGEGSDVAAPIVKKILEEWKSNSSFAI
jgi:penicillin-binding protein 2